MRDRFLAPAEAAKFLRRSRGNIYNMIAAGQLPYYKPGGKTVLFSREELEKWVRKSRVPMTNRARGDK